MTDQTAEESGLPLELVADFGEEVINECGLDVSYVRGFDEDRIRLSEDGMYHVDTVLKPYLKWLKKTLRKDVANYAAHALRTKTPPMPTVDCVGDPLDHITLPCPKSQLHGYLYEMACAHAKRHFDPRNAGNQLGDLRGYLGKELEMLADLLGCEMPDNPADVHPALLELSIETIETAYMDMFGEDVYL